MTGIARPMAAAAIGIYLLIGLAAPCRSETDESAAARLGRELAAEEAENGATSSHLLPVIEELVQARWRDGALDEAAALRRRALSITRIAFGGSSPSAARAMTALALVDIDRRRYLDAEPLLIIAERMLREGEGADRSAMAAGLAGLARIALARGELEPAEAWATRAVDIARANPDRRSAEPLRALGAVFTAEEHFEEAERVLDAALAQDRKQHGNDSTDTARSLSQLANLDLREGKAKEALALIEEATAIDQARLGATHPFIADDLHDLGLAYEALKRPEEARDAFLSAIDILERGAGRETPRVAYAELELSRLYREEGEDAAADRAFNDARRILNQAEAAERRRERQA